MYRKYDSTSLFYLHFSHKLISHILYHVFQKKAAGNDLYEQVFYSLDLIEKDYFGLQYTDSNNVQVQSLLVIKVSFFFLWLLFIYYVV